MNRYNEKNSRIALCPFMIYSMVMRLQEALSTVGKMPFQIWDLSAQIEYSLVLSVIRPAEYIGV